MHLTRIVILLGIALVSGTLSPRATAADPNQIKPDLSIALGEKATSAGGLVFDGKDLWISAQSLGKDLLLSYDTAGKPNRRLAFEHAGNIGGGLAYDGKDYFILDYRNRIALAGGAFRFTGNGAIFRLDPHGDLEKVLDLPEEQTNTFGLVHHKGHLYYGHSPTVRPSATIYKVTGKAVIDAGTSVDYYVRSLSSDGTSLWASSIKKVYRLNDDFTIAETFEPSVETAGIAVEGTHLWALEHNKNVLHRFKIKEAKREEEPKR
jgi:hypothetical protein